LTNSIKLGYYKGAELHGKIIRFCRGLPRT
jgi:hypothetical protein